MRSRILLASLLGLALCGAVRAQAGYEIDGNNVFFRSPRGDLRVQLCNGNMFRVTKSADSSFPEDEAWMVVRYDFDPVDFHVAAVDGANEVSTGSMRIRVQEDPWRITVMDGSGDVVYRETGSRLATGDIGPMVECAMAPDEHFFGFGERMDFLDQRGRKVHLNVELGSGPKPAVGGKDILRANYCPVPYFMSNKGYAVFFHTANPTDWDMGWSNPLGYSFSATGGDLDYYLILDPTVEGMIRNYQVLTGTAPLMPRSAYGLHVGSYSGGTWKYEECTSDRYPVDLVRRLRKEGIPFDLLWLDSTWRFFNDKYGNGGCCFEFRETFKDPQAMVDSIYANHVDMLGLHIRPIMDNGKRNTLLDDALAAGAVAPGAKYEGTVNFFDRDAVDWWWDNGVMRIASMGVRFVKTDCGGSLVYPESTPSNERLHNLYPIAYAKAPYEKFQEFNNQRGFNHTREGYAGIQRYPFIWAGDWGTEWQWFEPVIRGGLNIGLSGVGYWSHCMGGFEQYSPYDTDLYVRWCQFGMFSPVSILFGMDHPRYHEPWTYGEEAMATFIKYDSIRYSLMPYIYSNAYRMYRTSRPLMTPLLYDYLGDELTYQMSDQYMFGPALMVCPVTSKGALSRPVYFPGGKWIDFWTGERIEGRQYKSFLTPPDIMPIFIKEGAIIPKQPAMQYLGERPVDEVTLAVYPCGESSYDLYEDDGTSLEYMEGVCSVTPIRSSVRDGAWRLEIGRPEGKYAPPAHSYRIEGYWDSRPVTVTQNGEPMAELAGEEDLSRMEGWFYDEALGRVLLKTDLTNSDDITFIVQ